MIARQLPVGEGGMKQFNMRKIHVELYVTVREKIISSIREARVSLDIPFISLNLDLIKSKTSNQKFLALRIYFNSFTNVNMGFNLAVRRFCPSAAERDGTQLSDTLMQWANCVMSEFEIDMNRDILTSCSDSGSDVKRTLVTLVSAWWEWCLSHLTHLALTDAFGSHIDPAKSKHPEARRFISKIRKVIESINKSEYLNTAFEEKMKEDFGRNLKLLNSPQHRWSAVALVLKRILICWEAVKEAHIVTRRHCPLTDVDKTLCIEFYSLIEPVRAIQEKAQSVKRFVLVDIFQKLIELYCDILNDRVPLTLQNPHVVQIDQEPEDDIEQRLHEDLQPMTQLARTKLRKALDDRFYDRYHPIHALKKPSQVYGYADGEPSLLKENLLNEDLKFSYLLDAQVLFFPAMTSGKLIEKFVDATEIVAEEIPRGWTRRSLKEQHKKFILAYMWQKIIGLAEVVANKIVANRAPTIVARNQGIDGSSTRVRKKRKAADIDSIANLLDIEDDADNTARENGVSLVITPTEMINKEISLLKNIGKSKVEWPDLELTPAWWTSPEQKKRMPCLAQVALALLSCKPSAGGLECDLGSMSEVLAPKRSSLSPGFVEISMFLKINKELVTTNPQDVQKLDSNWKDYIPVRPPVIEDGDGNDEIDGDVVGDIAIADDDAAIVLSP